MKYVKADIGETWVIMYFSYGKYRVKILEEVGGTGNSTNVISDRKKEEYIYNDLLKENIYFDMKNSYFCFIFWLILFSCKLQCDLISDPLSNLNDDDKCNNCY